MALIDIDDEFIKLLYDITKTKVPDNVDLPELKKQLVNVVDTMKDLKANVRKPVVNKSVQSENDDDAPKGPAILVVDDLGVITYQLKVLLSEFQIDIDCSQEIYDAVNKYKKRNYEYVIMDLFIPTEREGFILLTELKKMAAANKKEIVVGVITASPRKEIEIQCKDKGADFFLEKNNDWQNQLRNIMDSYINSNNEEEAW